MNDELLEKINRVKKEMMISFTKYSLSGDAEKNDEAVLNSVLLSWLESVHSAEDLQKKYHAFQKMRFLIQKSYLFDFVDSILEDHDFNRIQQAIRLYQSILQNDEYPILASTCGYRLPAEFGEEQYYLDGSLKAKVAFYHSFYDKVNKLYEDLLRKGAFYR